jgi:hypothetical protein
MMDPFAEQWDGVRSYRFYLGRFVAYIKVDHRPFPELLVKAALRPEGPLHLIPRQFAASADFRAAEHVFAYEANRSARHVRMIRPDDGAPSATKIASAVLPAPLGRYIERIDRAPTGGVYKVKSGITGLLENRRHAA